MFLLVSLLSLAITPNFDIDGRISFEPGSVIKIVYVTEFDDDAARDFNEDVAEAVATGQPFLPVVINSYGGYVYSLLAMVDVLKAVKIPVMTIVEGKAMSCGAILFSCGTEGMRFIGPNATVMIHDVSAGAGGKIGDMIIDVREAERLNALIFSILSKNTKKPENYFSKIVLDRARTDWFLTPKEAVEHNVANKIGIPVITIKADIKYEVR